MRTVAALLLVLVVGLSPFWLGSNRPLPWGGNALVAGAVLGLAAMGILLNRKSHPPLKLVEIAFPLLLIGGVLGWAIVQTLPIGAGTHPAWQVAGTALGRDLAGAISVNPRCTPPMRCTASATPGSKQRPTRSTITSGRSVR